MTMSFFRCPRPGAAPFFAGLLLATFVSLPARAASAAATDSKDATSAGVPAFDGKQALALIAKQLEFGPRNPGSAGHAACLGWLKERLQATSHQLAVEPFELEDPYGSGTLALTNLRASFYPNRARRIALAAHWDTRPRADQQPGGEVDKPIPGANDGGSGVAVLLSMARILKEHPLKAIGVDLLFFDGEDYGREGDTQYYLLGSKQYVSAHPGYRPRALILLDMVAGKNLSISMERNGLQRAQELSFLVFSKAASLGLPAFVSVPGQAILDDHIPFLINGVESVDLIDLDYRQWHTLQDDLPACSAASLQQVGDLLVALLYEDFERES
jgi:hypothetical protein